MRRGQSKRGTAARLAAATITVFATVDVTLGATASVTVSSTPAGVTPRYVGYNMGHYMPGSNTSAWLEYSGVNAFRWWAASSDYEPTNLDDLSPYGDNVTSLQQFDERKTALRADPEYVPPAPPPPPPPGSPPPPPPPAPTHLDKPYINWSQFNSRFETRTLAGRNKARLNYSLGEIQKLGVENLLQTTRSNAYVYDGTWGSKWEQWQHYYAMGYHVAKNFDGQKLQMYNEPDLDDVGSVGWEERMRLASDAFKSAVEDVNRIYGKSLVPQVWAPVAADQDGTIDTWGKVALENNRTDYAGRPQSRDNFDVYDVHRYSNTGFAADQQLFDVKIPQYNATHANMPVAYTEFNRFTSGTFSTRSDNLDTDTIAAEWASIFPGAMSENVKAMYAFKFSQTEWTSSTTGVLEPQKTGMHFVSNTSPYNVSGGTRASEAMRLVAKAFKNERPRFSQSTSSSDSTYSGAASVDYGKGNYHYLSVNANTVESRNVTLNLASWNLTPGQVIEVQEVSQKHLGSLPYLLTVPANGIVAFTQPKASTVLLSVPMATNAQTLVSLGASADAQVSNAATTTNFGTAATADIARSASSNDDQATYLKFNRGANDNARVGRAFLHLTGSNVANADTTILHVYGIKTDTWTEGGITWSNAPDLGASATDSRLGNVGTDAFPVGQLTWDGTASEWGIDVTEFVRKNSDLDLSFVVIREERYSPGYSYDPDGDADTSRIRLNTREAASGQPRLSLYMTSQPTFYWSANPDSKNLVNFSATTSWDAGAIPNATGAIAVIGDFLTAPRTITMNAAATVGELRFDNWNSQKLSGSATLTLSHVGGQGMINVYKGNHTIDTPISLASATTMGVAEGLKLMISKPISGSSPLFKTGPGTLQLTATNTYTGGTTAVQGTLLLDRSHTTGSSLTAQNDARINLAAGGDKIIKTGTLAITGTAKIDLADNRLITTSPVGSATAGTYGGVTGLIQRGFAGGAWNGGVVGGLISSAAATTGGLTALGVIDASARLGIGETATGVWSGQTVTGASTLVMYTYGGDANLDGFISGDDYSAIDFAIAIPNADGWANGDFNYDGIISGDDYATIDFNIVAQGAPFPVAMNTSGVFPVPEPGTGGLVLTVAVAATRRRRRRVSER